MLANSGARVLMLLFCGLVAGPAAARGPGEVLAAKGAPGKAGRQVEITFSGFISRNDGSSTVYVELTGQVPVEVSQGDRSVTYTLRGAKVVLKNNKNPLLTRDFTTAVTSARLVPDKKAKSTRLVVELREPVTPTHKMVSRGRGFVLEVDFPPPKAAK
jgi:hypothetical protein